MLLDILAATGAVVAMLHSSTVIDTDPVIMYVIAQAQRWRCGRYRPDRTLVAPLSSTEYLDVPAEDAERELTVVFRGTCVPDGGKDPQYAGKRLRALLVKYLSKGGEPCSYDRRRIT